MRWEIDQSWLGRATLLAVTSFCMTGCAGGGGDSAASGGTTAISGVQDGSSPPSSTEIPSTQTPSTQTPSTPGTQTPSTNPSIATTGNHAPTLSGTPAALVVVGTEYTFQFAANDADGDALKLTVQNLPRWAQFDAGTQRLSGTPSAGDSGTYSNIVISASDGSSTVSMPAFSVQVVPVAMGQVTVSWQAPTTNTDGSALTNLSGYKIYFGNSSDNLNRSVQIDNAGLSSYVIDNLAPATYYFAITALNGSGAESARSSVISKTL